jgi:hypothetical protein
MPNDTEPMYRCNAMPTKLTPFEDQLKIPRGQRIKLFAHEARLYPLFFGISFAGTMPIFFFLGIPGNPVGRQMPRYTPF